MIWQLENYIFRKKPRLFNMDIKLRSVATDLLQNEGEYQECLYKFFWTLPWIMIIMIFFITRAFSLKDLPTQSNPMVSLLYFYYGLIVVSSGSNFSITTWISVLRFSCWMLKGFCSDSMKNRNKKINFNRKIVECRLLCS